MFKWNIFTGNFDIDTNVQLDNPLQFKGDIGVNTDFPLLADVETGWLYTVSASVTDDAGVLYTNTGLSFVLGDEIAWDGVTWVLLGNTLNFVPYTGATGNVDLGENEVFSKNINRLEILPKKIKRIVLKNASPVVLQPDDEYTYVFDLEAEYSEVVISGWDWISKNKNVVDKPSINLGRAVFKGNCLYIKNNKTIRIFEKQQNVELIDDTFISIPWGSEVEDGVPALGHGINVNDVLLLNADFNFVPIKKLIVKDVFLDGTDLKIIVKNVDSVDITISNFIGFEEVNVSRPMFCKVAGQKGLFFLGGGLNTPHNFSVDGGETWRIKDFGISAGIVSTAVRYDGNNYLMGFIDYFSTAKSYVYNYNSDSFEEKASNLFSSSTYKISREYTGGGTARNLYGCEPMSWKGNVGLLAVDKSFKPTLLKTTNSWESVSEVGEFDSLIPSIETFEVTGANNSAIFPHAFVVDDDNWYWASQYYGGDPAAIKNFVGKTVDGGSNWTNVMQDAEFVNAYSFRINVIGDVIVVVCVTKDDVNYGDGDMIFNISKDGGSNWEFVSGSWGVVVSDGEMTTAYKNANVNTRLMMKNTFIFYSPVFDHVIVGYRSGSNIPMYRYSADGGVTWSDELTLPHISSMFLSNADSNAHEVSGNHYIGGFASYGDIGVKFESIDEFADFDVWGFEDE